MSNIYLPKKYKILSITPQSPIEFLFKVETDLKPEAGQFLQVSIPKVGEAPISVADFNHEEGWIEFLIRKVGKVTDAVFNLEIGDYIFLRGPYGNSFPLEKFKGKRVVILAGGSGIAPVRPLIKTLIKTPNHDLELLFGFKDQEFILFKKEIDSWRQNTPMILTVDKGCGLDGECVGLVTEYIPHLKLLHSLDNLEVIIVGPPMMMKFSALEFIKQGVSEENVWVSFERNMSCAVGKCGHCKIDETYICLDGPIFNYTKAKKLLD
ncbi:anaerobic sulfite reductase subunit AsrB [Cetobacterium sp. 8H]|uniref:anaerobic sulfite reductase subunit AsrB n=1 Tax=Cetobacterium sp. 8H TaxID=2759681 RepID=UPI00163BD19A|nr:anaerobic sulfite reductase subunit AsrB [Cetobacterium sp. 8H]MBC2850395.1 anaerobic sulfite reductase subunit AsrB [Cetobacterium sp. 8H]